MASVTPTRANRQWLAGSWLALLTVVGLVAPYVPLPFAPAVPDLEHMSVSPAAGAAFGHWLGTDPLGRDVLANLVFGAQTVLLLILPAGLLAAFLGAVLGGVAGFWGRTLRVPLPGWLLLLGLAWWGTGLPVPTLGLVGCGAAVVWFWSSRVTRRPLPAWPLPLDSIVLATTAALGTVPRLLLVVALAAGRGLTFGALLVLLTLTSWPGAARLVRAETLRIRALPFVEAARALGLPPSRIWLYHIMPLALRPLRTDLPLSLATLVGLESTLAFLGVGLPPNVASWGRLIGAARLDTSAWWTAAFPMALLVLTIASLRTLAQRPAKADT